MNGWIENSAIVRKRAAGDGIVTEDYHSDICYENFVKWLEQHLPNLPPNSVIVSFT